jgi:hypothetical protein
MTLLQRRSSSPMVVDSTRQWCPSTYRKGDVSKEHSKQQNLHRATMALGLLILPHRKGGEACQTWDLGDT